MKKRTNKLFAMVLATVVSVSTLFSSTTTASASILDDVAPVISNIITDTTEYSIGDTMNVSIDITEEGTGLKYAYVSFYDTTSYFPIENGDLSGTYTTSLNLVGNIPTGEATIGIWAMDLAGNLANESFKINLTNSNYVDSIAPVVESYTLSTEEATDGDIVSVNVVCNDKDLSKLSTSIHYTDIDIEEYKEFSVSVNSINDDGLYSIECPIDNSWYNGNWMFGKITTEDTNGNTMDFYDGRIVNISGCTEYEADMITVDSLELSKDPIVLPGIGYVTIKGTATVENVETVLLAANNSFQNTVPVVDGKWEITITVPFPSSISSDGGYVSNVIVMNKGAKITFNYDIDTFERKFTLLDGIYNVAGNISLNNSKITEHINNMVEGQTLLVNANTNVAPKAMFDALKGHNKNVVIDKDGIQWIINGKNITNETKNVDITTSIQEIDLLQYGYSDNANGVALVFAPNGILPARTQIRIKNDYVSNKFNLSSQLYLGFIKDSADDEEELSVSDNSVSMNSLEYEDELIAIEDAEVSYDGEYVSLFLNHNSSYILSDQIPTEKKKDNIVTPIPTTPSTPNNKTEVSKNNESSTVASKPVVENKKEDTSNNNTPVSTKKDVKVKKTSISKVTVKKNKVTIKTKKVSGCKYQVRYSTKKSMKSAKIKNMKSTSITLKLKRSTKYYVQVRSYKVVDGKKVYSAWSKAKVVKTK